MSQQFCLKWNNHMNNMMDVFQNLLSTESMVDVTLACDGLSLKAHKMVLSACSPFFQALFLENPCQHPIVILKDMKYTELKAIIEFMYHGEVNVAQEQLSALMKTAETLRVKGLAEVTNEKNDKSAPQEDSRRSHTDTPSPHSKRRKVRNRKRSLSGSDYSDSEREPKIKQPTSPDIEELSGDISMDASSGQYTNVRQSRVPMQSHSSNSYKTSSVASTQDLHMEAGGSENESDFGADSKLLQQTITSDDARRRLSEPQRRPKSSTDHSMGMSIVPTSLPSDDNSQQPPQSPPDIKPELLELDPPMSPVAGTSHSTENAMVVYGDPGPSTYSDNSALVPQDAQQQDTRNSKRSNPSFKTKKLQSVLPLRKKVRQRDLPLKKKEKASIRPVKKRGERANSILPVKEKRKVKQSAPPVQRKAKQSTLHVQRKNKIEKRSKLPIKQNINPIADVKHNFYIFHMCSICTYFSANPKELSEHIKHHNSEGSPSTLCKFCLTTLTVESFLASKFDTKYKCDVCCQFFCAKFSLRYHKFYHH